MQNARKASRREAKRCADHANELHQRILVRARHRRIRTLIDRLDKAGL